MDRLLYNFIADFELRDVPADFYNLSGVLVSHNAGDRDPFVAVLVEIRVGVAATKPCRVHADEDFLRARFWPGLFLEFDSLNSRLNDGFHCV